MLRLMNPGPLQDSYCPPAPTSGQPGPRDFLSSQALTHTSPTPTRPGHPAQAPGCNVIPTDCSTPGPPGPGMERCHCVWRLLPPSAGQGVLLCLRVSHTLQR